MQGKPFVQGQFACVSNGLPGARAVGVSPQHKPRPSPLPPQGVPCPGGPSPPPAPIHTLQPCLPSPWSPAPEPRPCSWGVATALRGIEWSGALSRQEELTVETAGQDLVS